MKAIIIQGTVGSGKTTLCNLLTRELKLQLFEEPVVDNPFLQKYYKNPKAYSFSLQLFMLNERLKQSLDMMPYEEPYGLMDLSIYGNLIFAKAMNEVGQLSNEKYKLYEDIFMTYQRIIQPPALMVYLRCSTGLAIERIIKRNRPTETKASIEYWKILNRLYEEWFDAYHDSKKIVFDIDKMDIMYNAKAFSKVAQNIKKSVHMR